MSFTINVLLVFKLTYIDRGPDVAVEFERILEEARANNIFANNATLPLSDTRALHPLRSLPVGVQSQVTLRLFDGVLEVVRVVKEILKREHIPHVHAVQTALALGAPATRVKDSIDELLAMVGTPAFIIRCISEKARLDQWAEIHRLMGLDSDS